MLPASEAVRRALEDADNLPVRNNASMAHPNSALVGESEAVLVINTVGTLLTYLEAKQREVNRAPVSVGGSAEPF